MHADRRAGRRATAASAVLKVPNSNANLLYAAARTRVIWALLLLVMALPCAWYYRKKRDRPNLVTRYL